MRTNGFTRPIAARMPTPCKTGRNVYCLFRKYVFLGCFALPAYAQDTQFLPEIDTHLTLNSHLRTYLQAKDDRDGGDREQFTFGPSLQFYLHPLIRLQRVTLFDLDDSKSRPLVLESGYRIISAPNTAPKNRAREVALFHLPLVAGILLADGNIFDFDWQNGKSFAWRYHNKAALQRTITIHSYHPIPFITAEPYYESQHHKWSATDLYAGCLFPIGKHAVLDLYYEHENDTGKKPNQSNNYVGLALQLYFSLHDTAPPPPATRH
jgi:hypothetical protein